MFSLGTNWTLIALDAVRRQLRGQPALDPFAKSGLFARIFGFDFRNLRDKLPLAPPDPPGDRGIEMGGYLCPYHFRAGQTATTSQSARPTCRRWPVSQDRAPRSVLHGACVDHGVSGGSAWNEWEASMISLLMVMTALAWTLKA